MSTAEEQLLAEAAQIVGASVPGALAELSARALRTGRVALMLATVQALLDALPAAAEGRLSLDDYERLRGLLAALVRNLGT